jgi:ABC-type transport system involved in multi-copper enzyme maturation permease subunit
MTATLTLRLLRRLWPLLAMPCALCWLFAFVFLAMIEPLGGLGPIVAFLRNVPRIGRLLGSQEVDITSLEGLASVAYVHPIVAIMMAVWPLSAASAALAGQVESGEADLVLSRAVPRRTMLFAGGVTLLAGCLAIAASMLLGTLAGLTLVHPPEAFPVARFAAAASLNGLFAFTLGSVFLLISSAASDRGQVLGWGVALWFASYFNGSVSPIFDSLEFLGPWSLHGHARPQQIVSSGAADLTGLAILGGVAAACLVLASIIWARRDIRS